mmetsp:Transcript_29509/g.68706  ORF Transcript_29509/g.68706 Transcript_29509/m.68706 type:complete len:208 (-) Transcript_29509:164-787(-)
MEPGCDLVSLGAPSGSSVDNAAAESLRTPKPSLGLRTGLELPIPLPNWLPRLLDPRTGRPLPACRLCATNMSSILACCSASPLRPERTLRNIAFDSRFSSASSCEGAALTSVLMVTLTGEPLHRAPPVDLSDPNPGGMIDLTCVTWLLIKSIGSIGTMGMLSIPDSELPTGPPEAPGPKGAIDREQVFSLVIMCAEIVFLKGSASDR